MGKGSTAAAPALGFSRSLSTPNHNSSAQGPDCLQLSTAT